MIRRALAILTLALVASALPTPALSATGGDQQTIAARAQSELIGLIDAYRAANGLQQVATNGPLTNAAAWMANDMASKNYIGHTSSDGRSPTQRMSAFGYPATAMYTGEDLGAGYGTAGAVLAAWQASAAHNAVLLNPNYDAIGIGLVYNASSTYKWFWAADFGGPGGAVKVVVPPPTPRPAVSLSAATPIPQRAQAVARGVEPQPVEVAKELDPETAAIAARTAFADALSAWRFAHLLAVLERIGAL